ncbi:MAG: YjfB family protein [Lachnospiraceae bacterium]|nr:YjfB family protein [Lachnospiraceae bacterium]
MDIARLSMDLANSNTLNKVSTAMLSKSLDTAEQQGASLIAMMDRSMELSVNPGIGSNFDMSV